MCVHKQSKRKISYNIVQLITQPHFPVSPKLLYFSGTRSLPPARPSAHQWPGRSPVTVRCSQYVGQQHGPWKNSREDRRGRRAQPAAGRAAAGRFFWFDHQSITCCSPVGRRRSGRPLSNWRGRPGRRRGTDTDWLVFSRTARARADAAPGAVRGGGISSGAPSPEMTTSGSRMRTSGGSSTRERRRHSALAAAEVPGAAATGGQPPCAGGAGRGHRPRAALAGQPGLG